MKNARLIAFETIYDIFQNGAYSNLSVDKALKNVEQCDKGFVSTLVYGVVERKITLDFILSSYLNNRTKPKVKILLFMGVYQLYFMDKIPSSAVINETVELSKSVGISYYKNLINAVLHKVDDNRIDIDNTDLSIKFSCPEHLINMWKKMYGEELTVKTLESINCKPPVFAIPNTLFVNAQELLYELNCCGINGEVVDDVVMLNTGFDVSKCKAFKYGLFYIEDMSSYNCAKALGVKENDVVLDVCSAPGGKTFTIAIGMNNTGNVYAYDLHKHRCDLVEKSAQRLDIKNISVSENDATIFNENIPLADKILCDVPCSGFGIIRRKPEIRYKNLDSIKELPAIQYQILETSSKYLKTGGRIIYSTCTLNKRENENVVNAFLQNNNNFTLLEQKTTFPSQFGGDGFFWALMEKKND